MKTIYIVLIRANTLLSKVIHGLTGDSYTHASISFCDRLYPLYSFGRKSKNEMFPAGLIIEDLERSFIGETIPCAVYRLQVSDDVYKLAVNEVSIMMKEQDKFYFNTVGLVLCKLGIPYKRSRHYFCSHFVSEILTRSKAISNSKPSSLMRPSDLLELPEASCIFKGELKHLITAKSSYDQCISSAVSTVSQAFV
ncbi:hypothetical protein D3C76_259230 [compost metagenome]